jgi:hypothetical protein
MNAYTYVPYQFGIIILVTYMFDCLGTWCIYDKRNNAICNPAEIIPLRLEEATIWSMKQNEFYVENTVLSFLTNTQPPMTITLTDNI